MSAETLLIDAWPGETRVALVRDDDVIEVWIDRDADRSMVGDIILGRVESLSKPLNAAFVDIGLSRPSFLNLKAEPPTEGTALMVQVLRDPSRDEGGDKGAKVTAKVTLTGQYLVLTPGDGAVRPSKKISDEERRQVLRALLDPLKPDVDTGFVVRTAAEQAPDDVIAEEAGQLAAMWTAIQTQAKTSKPITVLQANGGIVTRVLADHPGSRARITGPDALVAKETLTALVLESSGHIETDPGGDCFDGAGIDAVLDDVLLATVPLPSGGSLTIEQTAAVVAIDVNAAGRRETSAEKAVFALNLEAATEIARQVRLRSLSGLMVIDFARMKSKAHKGQLIQALRAAFVEDPSDINVAGFTTFGLVEVTRQRRRMPLADAIVSPATNRESLPIATAYRALRACMRMARTQPMTAAQICASPPVAQELTKGAVAPARAALQARLGVDVRVISDEALSPSDFDIKGTP